MAISASIQALLAGEQVAGSKLSSKLRDELLAEGLLLVASHGSRNSYRARDTEALKRYLIDKDESYRMLEIDVSDSRASMAAETGNSKLAMVRSCPGFPVNSYEPIECSLDGKPFMVNPQEGSFLFVAEWEMFTIPEDVVVLGIENMENFRMIRKQRTFFEKYLQTHQLSNRVLFVSRYPQSTDLRRWLCAIPNHYLHFGDFDLAGVNIFLFEFQQYLGKERSSFLIPDDIETRLNSGSRKRYDEQYSRYKGITSDVCELQQLIDLICQKRKAYDQEGYILKG
ncbi:hypothetical protein [Parabacteroides sp. AF17-28]|uniref:DUF7281 domain-containing protein n=1 Tax=Parabacteroides sp. AF17-28 TaxID=2292241 RepID=UPI000EFDB342|nr:hypothetical protein [Parabacteroides sp. AF17-28]RHR53285.1 hypothetical protein DWW90_16590 [Parabacteroides sp. AF17-28]